MAIDIGFETLAAAKAQNTVVYELGKATAPPDATKVRRDEAKAFNDVLIDTIFSRNAAATAIGSDGTITNETGSTFTEVRSFLQGIANGSTVILSPLVLRANAVTTITASDCVFYFRGLELIATQELSEVLRITGNRNTFHGFNVNGGYNEFTVPGGITTITTLGVHDTGSNNRFIGCQAGFLHSGSSNNAFELLGDNTYLHGCNAIEAGARSYRNNVDGLVAIDCGSFFYSNRPEIDGTTIRRHFGYAATGGRTQLSMTIQGGKWYSDYQWASSVCDTGSGVIQNLRISNIDWRYGPNTPPGGNTGNAAFNCFKMANTDGEVIFEGITCRHPTVNDAMFINVTTRQTMTIKNCKYDGYIGVNHLGEGQTGSGGGRLNIQNCEGGLRTNNRTIVGGFQTNSATNFNNLKEVVIKDCKFRAVGHPNANAGLLWSRSNNRDKWTLDNVYIEVEDTAASIDDFVLFSSITRSDQVRKMDVTVKGVTVADEDKFRLARTAQGRLMASAIDDFTKLYCQQIINFETSTNFQRGDSLPRNADTGNSSGHSHPEMNAPTTNNDGFPLCHVTQVSNNIDVTPGCRLFNAAYYANRFTNLEAKQAYIFVENVDTVSHGFAIEGNDQPS